MQVLSVKINDISGINWFMAGIMAQWHKAFLCPEFRFQTPACEWHWGVEPFFSFWPWLLFLLSQGSALGDSPDAVCSCQWGNPWSLWHGCKGNYRFGSDQFSISTFQSHLSCLLRWFLLSSRGGSRLLNVQEFGISSGEQASFPTPKCLGSTDLLETLPHRQKWCNKCNKWCSKWIF